MRRAVFPAILRSRAAGLIALALVAFPSAAVSAESGAAGQAVRAGVFDAPPFSMKSEDGEWVGLSVELFRAAARSMGRSYELREYADLAEVVNAVQTGEVDVMLGIASSASFETSMDLTHAYYSPSGSGIAVSRSESGFSWLGLLQRVFSWEVLKGMGVLLMVWVAAGTIVWLFERRHNRAMFGEHPVEGIGNGIWWAAVTMTTVGYGDKAPRTLGGRTVAIVWMFASIVLISSFTASITTSLTLEGLGGRVRGVQDLHRLRVGATAGSDSFGSLVQRGIATQPFADERAGLRAVAEGQLDAFVFNSLVLRHLVRAEFSDRVRVLPATFNRYNVKMAVASGSPLREPLNRALLEVTRRSEWARVKERYIGSDD